jgi:hypothetical protein
MLLAAGLAACQAGSAQEAPQSASSLAEVPAFAQAVCGDCHALAPPDLSPNPEAPSFYVIANRPGLTQESLTAFLIDAHNYPMAMDFDLEAHHSEELAAYIVTLQDPDYTPPHS